MDNLIVLAKDAKDSSGYVGSTDEFKHSAEVVSWCVENRRIIRLSPQEMTGAEKNRYTDFLVSLMREYLIAHPKVTTWSEFASLPENNKTQALFHQFGVRGEVFGVESFQDDEAPRAERSRKNLTFMEFYELCQIQFHYEGSFGSFKKLIARKYGSFAEYCILRGYDINGTKWENDETAIRVAQKLGSLTEIKNRAGSLYKYLHDHRLLSTVFNKKAS